MKHYVVYDATTGTILRAGMCAPGDLELQATQPNEAVIEAAGLVDDHLYEVTDGVLAPRQQAVVDAEARAEKLAGILRLRTRLLASSDWTQLPDSPFTAQQRIEFAAYRQALRDLPASINDQTDLDALVWPEYPG